MCRSSAMLGGWCVPNTTGGDERTCFSSGISATVDSRQPLLSVRHSAGGSPIRPSTSTPRAVGVPSAATAGGGCPISRIPRAVGVPSAASAVRRVGVASAEVPSPEGSWSVSSAAAAPRLDDEAAVAVLGGLQFDERSVTAVRVAEQILGRALFDDPSVLQKNDSVGARHGRQSMRDDHDKLVLGGLL